MLLHLGGDRSEEHVQEKKLQVSGTVVRSNPQLLVEECTVGYAGAVISHHPFRILFFLEIYAVKNQKVLT
ncbi:hypothetical protein TREES_T100011376 [Tupaia chinensis]|uniref:Uncharacterized protein n=1 Tax=Tupaia chinensis TaxID=246437 RepID=L9LCS5_TUPCH|nr:hypothetical protein TREES_T100011376 [Tupaia chinensis]